MRPRLIQTAPPASVGTGNIVAVSFAAPISAGSTIVLFYSTAAPANGHIQSVDVIGTVTPLNVGLSQVVRVVEAWKAKNVTGGQNFNVTCTQAPSNASYVYAQEWANLADVGSWLAANSSVSSTTVAPPSQTPTATGVPKVVFVIGRLGGNFASGPGGGFTPLNFDSPATTKRSYGGYQVIDAPDGATAYAPTITQASGTWEAGSFIGIGVATAFLVPTTQPSAAISGAANAPSPALKVTTTNGTTTDTSYVSNVTATLNTVSGSGSLSGTPVVAAVAGIATFNNLRVTGAGTFTLTFSAAGFDDLVSAPFTVTAGSNNPPVATITAPATGGSVASGVNVNFTGTGTDTEDGTLSGASLVWSSSRDGALGTGVSINVSSLSVGTHTITLTAIDSASATGVATITITITGSGSPKATRLLLFNAD